MTQQAPLHVPVRDAPATARPSARLAGLDLARGLAVLGMYTAHLGPDPSGNGVAPVLLELTHGRSSALFALLAGVSLVIIAGRDATGASRSGRSVTARIAVRAGVLVVLGTVLTALDTSIDVILASYGLYFLLALPLLRLRAGALAALAAVWALIGPQLLHVLRDPLYDSGVVDGSQALDPLARVSGEGLVDLLVTGSYPALAWMPLVLAGMAVGRLDLRSDAVRRRLAVLGPALVVLGYGTSWLALRTVPQAGSPQGWWSDTGDYSDGPAGLLVAVPHSQTTLSVVGNAGVAITVLAVALTVVDRLPAVRRALRPVIAVGTMSLSAYVAHIVALYLLGMGDLEDPSPGRTLSLFVVGVLMWAVLWKCFFRRGPLEYVVHRVSAGPDRR
ncbi:heparan-alpha-glucosaminide N-acetyltransferase domain-containing protein [Streptomyces minutiscleroticus]|uniref:heparan-alpha-glucosaminide N-acetyltransferase domain-containing protein n=1 Tax=Streptomyces minutiscleroticus TaxID=68238 RepID=UPI00332B5EBC